MQDTGYDTYTFAVTAPDVNKDSQWHGQCRPSDKNRSLESAVFCVLFMRSRRFALPAADHRAGHREV